MRTFLIFFSKLTLNFVITFSVKIDFSLDAVRWQLENSLFFVKTHLAGIVDHHQLDCCGAIIDENNYIIWLHNFKEGKLVVLTIEVTSPENALLLIREAVKEARKFTNTCTATSPPPPASSSFLLKSVVIWAPQTETWCRGSLLLDFGGVLSQRTESLSSLALFTPAPSSDNSAVIWLNNEKYCWV